MPTPQCPKQWIINADRVLLALRDAIKHTPGGSRFTTAGRRIVPLGVDYAAEVCGRRRTYMDVAINPHDESHGLQLKDFLLLVQAGLDDSVLDELERIVGRVAFRLPDGEPGDGLADELLRLGKEFGDVFEALSRAMRKDSEDGERISPREMAAFDREVDELISRAAALREMVRRSAG